MTASVVGSNTSITADDDIRVRAYNNYDEFGNEQTGKSRAIQRDGLRRRPGLGAGLERDDQHQREHSGQRQRGGANLLAGIGTGGRRRDQLALARQR